MFTSYISWHFHTHCLTTRSFLGCKRKIFLRGQSHFSWFFSRREMLFPSRKFPFWLTQNKFQSFLKVKRKKKKDPLLIFVTFPPYIIFHLPFLNFPSFFPIFPFFFASLFPIGQQKFPGQKSLGGTLLPAPCLPPPCYTTGSFNLENNIYIEPIHIRYRVIFKQPTFKKYFIVSCFCLLNSDSIFDTKSCCYQQN